MLPGQECLYFRQLSGCCCSAAPLCYAGEALSYQVIRDAGNRAAILVNGDNKVQIPLDTDAFHVNEQLHQSAAPPEIVQGPAMLSTASIGAASGMEAGCDIIWEAAAQTVLLRSGRP